MSVYAVIEERGEYSCLHYDLKAVFRKKEDAQAYSCVLRRRLNIQNGITKIRGHWFDECHEFIVREIVDGDTLQIESESALDAALDKELQDAREWRAARNEEVADATRKKADLEQAENMKVHDLHKKLRDALESRAKIQTL